MNNSWISVNERLPVEGADCIVANYERSLPAIYQDGAFRFPHTNHRIHWADPIAFWQPLPDPPTPPDPFEEWWKHNKPSTSCFPEGYRLIGGYNTPKCTARFIWDAALKSKDGK